MYWSTIGQQPQNQKTLQSNWAWNFCIYACITTYWPANMKMVGFHKCSIYAWPLEANQNQNWIVLYVINSEFLQTFDNTLNLFCAQLVNIWKGLQNSLHSSGFFDRMKNFKFQLFPKNPAMAGNEMGFVTQNILEENFAAIFCIKINISNSLIQKIWYK